MRLPLPALLAACFALLLPAQATAAHRPIGFDAAATISSCGGESLTVAAEIAPAAERASRRARRQALRTIRGATLLMRFEAAPLVGAARRGEEVDLGRQTSARRYARFAELPAESYTGIVRYRWVRGANTVADGVIRTTSTKAAGRRGRAFCSLPVGKPPKDVRPPFVVPIPFDGGWKRGPLAVQLYAVDDLSGVAAVLWRLDGGPVRNGRSLTIAAEGSHELQYAARDAAGNQTKPVTIAMRVDTNQPTVPTVTAPAGSTTDTTPDIAWNRSADTGSGVQSYLVLVRNAGGVIVYSQTARGFDPTAITVAQPLATGQYSAEVIAIDGTAPEPYTSKASNSFSVIDPGTAGTADSDADGRVDGADNCPFTANPDQADLDLDGSGDACDPDDDNDGTPDGADACPRLPAAGNDGCPPSVTSSSPASGEVRAYARRKDDLTVTFSEPMNEQSVRSATTLARGPDVVPTVVTCNNPAACTTAIVNPTGDLSGSYTLSVSTSATSAHGDHLGAVYSAAFTVDPYATGFDDCPVAFSSPNGGKSWECGDNRSEAAMPGNELALLSPFRCRPPAMTDRDSVAITAPISFDAATGEPLRIAYTYLIEIGEREAGDVVTVDVLEGGAGGPTLTSKPAYTADQPAPTQDSIAFNATAADVYAVKFTTHLEPSDDPPDAGGACDLASGPGVFFDNLTVGRP